MTGPLDTSYVRRKFAEAVEVLATSDEPLKKRIEYAVSSIFALDEGAFKDDELRKQYLRLKKLLTSAPDERNEGTIPATLRVMTPEQAGEVAELFVQIALGAAEQYKK